MFELILAKDAHAALQDLVSNLPRLKKVQRALARLESDPRHPGLNSHQFHNLQGPLGEPIWESYVENQTPAAWRIWWYYGPNQSEITIIALGQHP